MHTRGALRFGAAIGLVALSFLMAASMGTAVALADTNGTYNYTVSGGQATIDQYVGVGGAVTVPSTLGGVPVTSIGDYAFESCTTLTSVAIPSGVTTIGLGAFAYCDQVTVVTIPASVASIGHVAFFECTSLISVTIPSGVTSIGFGLLDGCTSLTNVTIPSGVTTINQWAFAGCTSLTSITIPGSVTDIGQVAFEDCYGLTSAYFLGNAPLMGSDVFSQAAPGFTVYYINGSTGFVTPPGPWEGYTTAYFTPEGVDVPVTSTPASSGWSLTLLGVVAIALLAALGRHPQLARTPERR